MAESAISIDRQGDPVDMLNKLMNEVYGGSIDGLALGLGRPTDEIGRWMNGSEEIDEDAEFKIRRLCEERLG
jgi:hypothetical protein